MKIKRLHLLLAAGSLTLVATSCMGTRLNLALSFIGAYKKTASLTTMTNDDKTVAFIPMIHIGTREFYNNVKQKVDSLQKDGYIVYMESVRVTEKLNEAQKDTLRRKLRYLMGTDMGSGGYLDTINGRLMGYKFKNKKGIINQPRYYKLGVDTLTARLADVPANVLIREYEKKHGKIQLADCDYVIPFEQKYTCPHSTGSWMNDFVMQYRNEHLAGEVVADTHKKIAVLYGAKHQTGLLEELKKTDANWKYGTIATDAK